MKCPNISEILLFIIDKYGEEVLRDGRRLNAFLMDLAPDRDNERKLIVMCLREGILKRLYMAKRQPFPEIVINHCIKQLVANLWITEEAAQYAVGIIAKSIGLSCDTAICKEDGITVDSRIIIKGGNNVFNDSDLGQALQNISVIGFKALAANKSLVKVKIPDSVEKIMPLSFAFCSNLLSVEIGPGMKEIAASAFAGCTSVEKILTDNERFICKNGILIDKRERMTIKAENNHKGRIVNIPNGICRITGKTFEGSGGTVIQIPKTVEYIDEKAFFGMNCLEEIMVDSHNKFFRAIEGILYDRKGETLLQYPICSGRNSYYLDDRVKAIGKRSFSCANRLKMVTFTATVERIGYGAFEFCSGLESIILPYGVSLVGEKAFQYCVNLKSAMLSGKINEIGDCAFYQCVSLESVSIPANVQRIGNYAFWGCAKLSLVTIQGKVREIGYGAFDGCGGIHVKIKNNPYVENYCKAHHIKYSLL